MNASCKADFDRSYQSHLKHLKLKGLRPKTIEAVDDRPQLTHLLA